MHAPTDDGSRKLCRAARFYRLLLFLYPAPFRQKFGAEMLRLFKDQWRDVQPSKSTLRRLRFWLWLCADTGWAAGREHLNAMNESLPMRTSSRRLLPGLTAICCALALRRTPPNMIITASTLSWVCLIPASLLLLLAAYTAVILRSAVSRKPPPEVA